MLNLFNDLYEANKEIVRLRNRLSRIAIGVVGRYKTGLLPNEIEWGSQSKCDWKLAQEALDNGNSNSGTTERTSRAKTKARS
jgi:hypothetical protein